MLCAGGGREWSPKGAAGEFAPNVLFSETPFDSLSVGYGAAGGRSDEITIADGRLYLVRPDRAGGVQTRHATEDGDRHAMSTGRRFHGHVVFPTIDAAGHLRTVVLEDGARLWIQRR